MTQLRSSGTDRSPPFSRRAFVGQAAVGGALAVAGCLRRDTATDPTPESSRPPLIAHRGCAAENPENTVAAVRAAAETVDRVEVDVRQCGTGELVVIHDETLDRVTDASGRVDRTSRETLSELDVDGSGEPVPTLSAVFEAAPADVSLLLDLKEPGLVDDALAIHATHDHELRFVTDRRPIAEEALAADTEAAVAYVVRDSVLSRPLRPVVPGLPTWLYPPQDVAETVETVRAVGCDAIAPRYELCLATDLVAHAHDAGLRVLPWTIASSREYATLAAVGVDAVISDVCRGLDE